MKRPSRRSSRAVLLTTTLALASLLAACSGENDPGLQPAPSTSTSPTQSSSPTPTAEPLVTGVVRGQDGWSTYTNAELGFRVRFPSKISVANGFPCTKENEGSSDFSYRPAAGVVPATVVQDGDWFYITQKYGYQLGDAHTRHSVTMFDSCTKTTTTVKVVRSYQSLESGYLLSILPVLVTSAHNRGDVEGILSTEYFACDSLSVTGLSAPKPAGWREVGFTCDSDPMFFNGMTDSRLYPQQGLFVLFSLGQAIQIYDARQDPADPKITKTFQPVS